MNTSTRSKRTHYFLALLALFTTLTATRPLHSAEYQYTYPIVASTAIELLKSIREQSTSPNGAIGYTELDTHVGWTALVDGEGTCTIETVDFTYDITIYMPQWTNKHSAKQCLQDNWAIVWDQVQKHEEQHRILYRLLDVNDINQRIAAIKPQKSCDVLKTVINSEIEKILNQNDKLHDRFHAADATPTLWDC